MSLFRGEICPHDNKEYTMKKITVTAIAVYAFFRHGWRCLSALAGVFAKQKLQCIITAGMLLLCTCATGGASAGKTVTLDQAIQEASRNIEENVQAGQKIAVLNFTFPTEQFSAYVIDELSIQLANGKKIVVVDRRELELIRQEERFQLSGEVSDESAQAIGRKLGAQLVISGSLTAMGNAYRFRIRALNVESAAVETGSTADLSTGETKIAFMLSGGSPASAGVPAPVAVQPAPTPAPVQPAAVPQRPMPDNFVRINGGTFTMGSPANEPERQDREGPQHQVTVSSFYMGRTEVTQREWYDVMGTTVRQQRDKRDSSFSLYGEGDNYPMYYVNWFEAAEYCNKRSQKEGLTPAYTINGTNVTWNQNANGYRLPTEAEWEYACRAGTTTAYNTGASISGDTGWYGANSGSTSHPVGQKPANRWGLHDMHGNVYEWCWDWYGDYESGAQTDPQGASSEFHRVLRGGGWLTSAEGVRSARRVIYDPDGRSYDIGFRLVRN